MVPRIIVVTSTALSVLFACASDPASDPSSDAGSSAATTTTTATTDGTSTGSTAPTEASGTASTGSTATPTTSTGSTGSTDTSEATSTTTTETTGDPFFCAVDMDGCCEVFVPVEADTFFSDAIDLVGDGGCPLVPNPPPEFDQLECDRWSFGSAETMRLFRDDGTVNAPVAGTSTMALRFPMQDGALLFEGAAIASELIEASTLELGADVAWQEYADLQFSLHGIDADEPWQEGDGVGPATPCLDGNASFACAECGASLDICPVPWQSMPPMDALGVVAGPMGQDPAMLALDLAPLGAPSQWLPAIAGGLVVAPDSSTYAGESLDDLVPFGGLAVKARESGEPPRLRLRLCQP